MPESNRVPILELRGISKRFGAVQALSGVNFEIYAGEVVGLVGDNGAGKSTLIKCVAGIHPIDEGEIWFEGQRVHIQNPKDAANLGIQTVYQDLALCDNLDVVANLFLGREQITHLSLDEVDMERRSIEVLRELSVSIPSVRTIIASLSGGQRQSVAISRGHVEFQTRDSGRADRGFGRVTVTAGFAVDQELAPEGIGRDRDQP